MADAALPQDVDVEVQLACATPAVPAVETLEAWVRRAIAGSGRVPDDATAVTLRLVSEDEIRQLNERYRQQARPTNVLAFPAAPDGFLPPGEPRALGDVAICGAVVEAEALSQGKTAADHWAHLVVHGTLHLLGFDHGNDTQAREMEALERRILASDGIADPYTSLC